MDAFISYSFKDRHLSDAVSLALKDAGLNVGNAETLGAGENWGARIREEIERSKCFVALWSGGGFNANVAFEIGLATALNKPVYLFVSDEAADGLPFDLGWASKNVKRLPAENLQTHAIKIAEELAEPAS
jgi:hypothetical protein